MLTAFLAFYSPHESVVHKQNYHTMKIQFAACENLQAILDNLCNTEIERRSLKNLLEVHGIEQISTYPEYCEKVFNLDTHKLATSGRNTLVLMDSISFNAATAIDMLNNVLAKLKDIVFKAQSGILGKDKEHFFKLIDNFLENTDLYYVNNPYLRCIATKNEYGKDENIPSLFTATRENAENWLHYERNELRTSIIVHMPEKNDILGITESSLNPFNEAMVCDIMALSICYERKNLSAELFGMLMEHKIEDIPEEHE